MSTTINPGQIANFLASALKADKTEAKTDPLSYFNRNGSDMTTLPKDSPVRDVLKAMVAPEVGLSAGQLDKFRNTVNEEVRDRFEEMRRANRIKAALGEVEPKAFAEAVKSNGAESKKAGDKNIQKHFEKQAKIARTYDFNNQITGLENLPANSSGAATLVSDNKGKVEQIIIDAKHPVNAGNAHIPSYNYTYGYEWGSSKQHDPLNNSLTIKV